MNRFLLGVALSLSLGGAALAYPATETPATVNADDLTVQQRADLAAQVATLRSQNIKMGVHPDATPDQVATQRVQQVSEYVAIGKGIAQGLGAAAKELNVAVNDFAKTPVGQLTTFLIVYKVIGHDVVHLGLGLLWILTATPIWFYFYQKMWKPSSVTTNYYESGKKQSVTRTTEKWEGEAAAAAYLTRALALIPAAAIIIISFIILP